MRGYRASIPGSGSAQNNNLNSCGSAQFTTAQFASSITSAENPKKKLETKANLNINVRKPK
jgi:hypothetical protein